MGLPSGRSVARLEGPAPIATAHQSPASRLWYCSRVFDQDLGLLSAAEERLDMDRKCHDFISIMTQLPCPIHIAVAPGSKHGNMEVVAGWRRPHADTPRGPSVLAGHVQPSDAIV